MMRSLCLFLMAGVGILQLACDRRSAEDLYRQGEAALGRGAQDEAIALLQKAVRKDNRHEKAHYRLGRLYQKADQDELAVSHFQQAARIDPDEPKTQFRLGDAYLDVGKTSDAIGSLKMAILLDPRMGGPYAKLAQAYRRTEDEHAAREIVREGLRVVPHDDPYYDDLKEAIQ